MFTFFIENYLISPNQSGFKTGDSCINQLLSGVFFLDISKTFKKIWHNGIIFKLEKNVISRTLHKLLNDFLVNRKQMVVLNG